MDMRSLKKSVTALVGAVGWVGICVLVSHCFLTIAFFALKHNSMCAWAILFSLPFLIRIEDEETRRSMVDRLEEGLGLIAIPALVFISAVAGSCLVLAGFVLTIGFPRFTGGEPSALIVVFSLVGGLLLRALATLWPR